ncbi:MAG TPA: UDP-glucose/GDP-mannose dehydrogenase family protein [Candidatus Cloacimonadota bacterium]|nr:UDP-glucose/GDP-mannose dehydrogenase family protein [Candidatus Cloacimonadota bacterium]
MKIAVIGSGYVGLVSGTCFADMGNAVICVDKDPRKIDILNGGDIPIYEPGLKEMVIANHQSGRLTFTTNLQSAVEASRIIFIAVGTPPDEDGSADLSHVIAAAREIALYMNGPKIIVNKSTVPVGTADLVTRTVQSVLSERGVGHKFSVVSNPEFLKEGAAIEDFMKPDRVILGVGDEETAAIMRELYKPFNRSADRVIVMAVRSAEMTKYAANALLATKISFMNELSQLCETLQADISEVRAGIGSDSRIGNKFIYPGVGYGGSCFPKDVKALISMHRENGSISSILDAVEDTNRRQKMVLVEKLISLWGDDMSGKTVALWGLAFKPQTDDMREAPAIVIARALIERGARVQAFDPVAMKVAAEVFRGLERIDLMPDEYTAVKDTDAMLLVTEWHQFRYPDFERVKSLMKHPLILDGRNQYEPRSMKALGFDYYAIGRPRLS